MKLSKQKLREYREFLATYGAVCQRCGSKPSQDTHHLFFGRFGADKDDTSLVCLCRECHEWCHKNKHLSQEQLRDVAVENWKSYNA